MSKESEHLEEGPTTEDTVADWVRNHGRTVLYSILMVVVVMFGAYRWSQSSSSQAHQDFISAELRLRQMREDVEGRQEALAELTELLDLHEELHSKYDGLIAHELLKDGQGEEARPYLESSIARSGKENGALHHSFGQTSILIANGQLDEALKGALKLREQLKASENEGLETLRVFNNLRTAFLYQGLDQPANERLAWATLRSESPWLLEPNGKLDPTQQAILSHFSEGAVMLADYVAMREKNLH